MQIYFSYLNIMISIHLNKMKEGIHKVRTSKNTSPFVVAGAGLEPTTFGL